MRAYWHTLKLKYEALALRERLLVLFALMAVSYLIWDLAVAQPAARRMANLQSRAENSARSITALEAELQVKQRLSARTTGSPLMQQLHSLQQRKTELDQTLVGLSVGLVYRRELPVALRDLLRSADKVRLESVRTHAPQPIFIDQQSVKPHSDGVLSVQQPSSSPRAQVQGEHLNLYRQSLELEFSGGLDAVYEFLLQLESLSWQFYWETLEFKMDANNQARVALKLFSLSTGQGDRHE